jgi:ribosomal protein L7/L12
MDSAVRASLDALTTRIRVLEANVAVLAEQAGLQMAAPTGPPIPDEVKQLALSGNKLKAMQAYRQFAPGASVEEARAVVESI